MHIGNCGDLHAWNLLPSACKRGYNQALVINVMLTPLVMISVTVATDITVRAYVKLTSCSGVSEINAIVFFFFTAPV